MNTNLKTAKEVVVTTPDEVGVLSRISTAIAEACVNIHAICAYEVDDIAHLRLITDDNQKAMDILNGAGFEAVEHNVIISEVSPHAIHSDITTFAGGYDVESNYWCASAHSGEHAVLIFSPTENIKAAGIR